MNRADIERHINEDYPFGPIEASGIVNPADFKLLFNEHNEMYNRLLRHPSIILGRKGSGKTSYLRSEHFNYPAGIILELNTPTALQRVIDVIEHITSGKVFVETVAEVWTTVLNIWMFSQLTSRISDVDTLSIIEDYLKWFHLTNSTSVDDALTQITRYLSLEGQDDSLVNVIDGLKRPDDSTSYDVVRAAVDDYLNSTKTDVVVLIDSLDDFSIDPMSNYQVEMDSVARALQGLMKCVGQFNTLSNRIQLRFCLPAELYHAYLRISSNPLKDFNKTLTLHWTASELLVMAAQRLRLFLEYFDPIAYSQIKSLDISKRPEAIQLLQSVLPAKVTNGRGVDENAVSYILRHTQLLPRHFLWLLNSISSQAKNQRGAKFHLSEDMVVSGVRQQERLLVYEIFRAYKPVHPQAEDVCERCLPDLNVRFTQGDLLKVFNRHGKAAMGTDDYYDFRRLLIEIGAVGRITEETDLYIKGLYEYTIPHKLVPGPDDDLCIHPLFSRIFSAKPYHNKPVYPYGTDVNDPEVRDFLI